MIRVIIENIVLFLMPAAIYVTYMMLMRNDGAKASQVLNEAPLIWLLIAGACAVAVTMIAFGNVSGGKPGMAYEPTVLKDGKIEPGRMR
jgi:Family of unknown function (DUF6111)